MLFRIMSLLKERTKNDERNEAESGSTCWDYILTHAKVKHLSKIDIQYKNHNQWYDVEY